MVTGATSGLGEAAAIDLARCGAIVRIVARRTIPDKAKETRGNPVRRPGPGQRSSLRLSLTTDIRRFTDAFPNQATGLTC